ncbi:transposase [Uliginosibacterium paludis]|uniref:Transposase n=1 Tax=Uliginosibacterium paludis TaxID=1615952 RepID=A0ABV2CQD5_9RHOO
MPEYRRIWRPGGTYFFTVTLLERRGNDLLVRHIDSLRAAVRKVRQRYPFHIHAFVVLPDHLHCILELPEGDADFATRWMRIKQEFSFAIPKTEWRSATRRKRQERAIWQRRYWEHLIRDEKDFQAHMDYVHFNPVKHGHVARVIDWPHSSFHHHLAAGTYPADWGNISLTDNIGHE